MSRLLLASGVLVLAVAVSRAADPKPVWEIQCAAQGVDPRQVTWAGFSPDGKVLLARVEFVKPNKSELFPIVDPEEYLLAWETRTREERFRIPLDRSSLVLGLRANGITRRDTILVPDFPREVRLADGKEKRLGSVPNGSTAVWAHPSGPESVWLHGETGPDSNQLFVSARRLGAFDAKAAQPEPRNPPATRLARASSESEIRAVAASPDLARLAVAAYEPSAYRRIPGRGSVASHTLALYSVDAGDTLKLTELATVHGAHTGPISITRFSPDGKTLATGSGDSSLALWDVAKAGKDWKPRAMIPAGQYTVSCLAFSPDGRTLAAGTLDQRGRANLYLVDVPAGKLIASRRLASAVTAVAYSPDGQTLVTGLGSGKVLVWDAAAVRGD